MLGHAGIYTILDCHQDVWSPKFCGNSLRPAKIDCLTFFRAAGEGAPDFAALYKNRSVKPMPFPEPIPSFIPYKVDPNTGYGM